MADSVELHDSVVSACVMSHGELQIELFPCLLHRSDGQPGVDKGSVYSAHTRIVLGTAKCNLVQWSKTPFDLDDGFVAVAGVKYTNVVPVPLNIEGAVVVSLTRNDGIEITAEGTHISVELVTIESFLEEFP